MVIKEGIKAGFNNNQRPVAGLAAVGKMHWQAATLLQRCPCNAASRKSLPAFQQHLISRALSPAELPSNTWPECCTFIQHCALRSLAAHLLNVYST
ncbi:hypothetical protein E2C01_091451 [Portunus trituberculatus]|uniref:Uncharacterized protein n=1 Tax=Portunus trituberculatus TaxID=210409 RepID=A0A5B7JSX3_PORTR|nr:hypothetical protein [Portunus trituberculatus]